MTDNNYPITLPPGLVEQWRTAPEYASGREKLMMVTMTERRLHEIAVQATRYGADQELEACCEWVSQWCPRWPDGTRSEDELRLHRRPKPPSLKEQGRKALQSIHNAVVMETGGRELDVLKEIVESLPD